MVRGDVIEDSAKLDVVRSEWDGLAVAAANPYCVSGWLLSWWRHAAPAQAQLRAIVAFDGSELVGIAPFFATPGPGPATTYRLLGSGASTGVEPLATRGRELEAARVFAAALASAQPPPDLVTLEGIDSRSPWPALIRDAWPGRRPWTQRRLRTPAPGVAVGNASYEAWLVQRSSKLRKALRRGERRLRERGARIRCVVGEETGAALRAFVDLHHARWSAKGGSGVVTAAVERMLEALPRELGSDHLRVWLVDLDGRPISAEVFLAAGGVTTSWLGGFDESFADEQPSLVSIHAEVRQAFERGDTHVDLGPGDQPFKYRFANVERHVVWVDLVPRTRRAGVVAGALAARRAKRGVPRPLKDLLKRMLRRGPAA